MLGELKRFIEYSYTRDIQSSTFLSDADKKEILKLPMNKQVSALFERGLMMKEPEFRALVSAMIWDLLNGFQDAKEKLALL